MTNTCIYDLIVLGCLIHWLDQCVHNSLATRVAARLFQIRKNANLIKLSVLRSNPIFITQAEAEFSSTGGTLSARDSNVSINVDSGAIPDGVSQPIFFGVINDDTLFLRDPPETSDRTLISPIIQCRPEDINLSKPVEIVLPHCLCMDEVKKSSVSVYRCEQFPGEGNVNFFFIQKRSHS